MLFHHALHCRREAALGAELDLQGAVTLVDVRDEFISGDEVFADAPVALVQRNGGGDGTDLVHGLDVFHQVSSGHGGERARIASVENVSVSKGQGLSSTVSSILGKGMKFFIIFLQTKTFNILIPTCLKGLSLASRILTSGSSISTFGTSMLS